jgi:hypothetical protein
MRMNSQINQWLWCTILRYEIQQHFITQRTPLAASAHSASLQTSMPDPRTVTNKAGIEHCPAQVVYRGSFRYCAFNVCQLSGDSEWKIRCYPLRKFYVLSLSESASRSKVISSDVLRSLGIHDRYPSELRRFSCEM